MVIDSCVIQHVFLLKLPNGCAFFFQKQVLMSDENSSRVKTINLQFCTVKKKLNRSFDDLLQLQFYTMDLRATVFVLLSFCISVSAGKFFICIVHLSSLNFRKNRQCNKLYLHPFAEQDYIDIWKKHVYSVYGSLAECVEGSANQRLSWQRRGPISEEICNCWQLASQGR